MKSNFTHSTKIFIFLLLSFFSFTTSFAQLVTVTTDKLDYVPGEYVVVTGTNWLPGETVKLTFEETPLIHVIVDLYAIADFSGNINNSELYIESHDQGQEFKLTATGQTSGNIAITLFADSFLPGIAPVVTPLNFNIDGNIVATNSATSPIGDWVAGPNGAGVLNIDGSPINPLTTFHLTDAFGIKEDSFSGGLKFNDDPNTYTWVTSAVLAKGDINNALVHFSKDIDGQQWIMVAADHASNNGTVYIDFEFLQNKLEMTGTTSGGFTSSGPNGSRTADDFILTLKLTGGGSTAGFFISKWSEISPGVFDYVDKTASVGATSVFASVNTTDGTAVPFTAFGSTTYITNTIAEAAINLTAVLSAVIDPCKSFGIKTLFIKTISGNSQSSGIADFIRPIQVTFALGVADAGQNQTKCAIGASTEFQLAGVATPSPGDVVTSTKWTTVSGIVTFANDAVLGTTATVTSNTATIRLTVKTRNGCESFKDVVLTVNRAAVCSITSGSNDTVCTLSSNTYSGPAGATTYEWSFKEANGAIFTSVTNAQDVTVTAGSACKSSYTLSLTTTLNDCSSTCEKIVTVDDTTKPAWTTIAGNLDRTVQCSDTAGIAAAQALAPVASDNCTVTLTPVKTAGAFVAGSCPQAGTYTNTWTVSDNCSNAVLAVFTQTITIEDTTKPAWTTVAGNLDRTVQCSDTAGIAAAQALAPVASDNCTVTLTPVKTAGAFVAGFCPQAGTYTNTWTVSDNCSNAVLAVYTQTITIEDTTKPTWTTVAGNLDRTVQCSDTAGIAAAQALAPVASDNCTVTLTPVKTAGAFVAGSCPQAGAYTNTWTVSDNCSNAVLAVYTQTITIEDTTVPTFTAPENKTIYSDSSCGYDSSVTSTGDVLNESDNCSSQIQATYTDDIADGRCSGSHIITRAWSLSDMCGNKAGNQIQIITVLDTIAPIIVVQAFNIIVDCDGQGNQNQITNWLANNGGATASDNCSNVVWTNDFNALSNDCSAAVTVKFTATDACGNFSTTSATFTKQDITVPTIDTLATNATVQCDGQGNTTALNEWLASNGGATAADSCSAISWTNNFEALSDGCGATGNAEVIFTATDECGNASTSTATFTIQDTTAPTIDTVAVNAIVQCDGQGNRAALNTWLASNGGATATESCSAITWTNNFEALSDGCGATGTADVTFTATDECGNASSSTATFTIQDTTAPTIDTVAVNAIVQCDGQGNTAALNTWLASNGGATATESCSAITWTNNFEALSDGCGAAGNAEVIFTATDECGNASSSTATFTIQDTTAPTIDTVAVNAIVQCDGQGNTAALNTWLASNGGATATESCSAITWTNNFEALSDGCGAAGNAEVIFTATDECGNASTSTATFTIQDTTAPTIDTVATNATVQCDGQVNTTALNEWLASNGGATATDSCSAITWTNNFEALSDGCGATGNAEVIFTATDECGNASTSTATFTIQDTTAPTIDTVATNATVQCDGLGNTTALNEWLASNGGATAADSCSAITWTNNFEALSDGCGATGNAEVIFTATDECGNASTSTATFTIQDTTAPTIDTVATNATVECDGQGNTAALNTWLASNGGATATESCSAITWTNNFEALSDGCGATGTAEVIFTATDECGNASTSTATFTIQDTTAPTIDTVATNATVQCDGLGNTTALNEWLASNGGATATDSCSAITWTNNFEALSDGCGATGAADVTFTATDECGNASSSTATFTIQDTTAPAFVETLPASEITIDCKEIPAAAVLTAIDNCSGNTAVIFSEKTINVTADSYSIVRKWNTTDSCDNEAEFIQIINVIISNTTITVTSSACNDDTTTVDLNSLLPDGTPANGTWIDINNSGALEGNILSPFGVSLGDYTFEYKIEEGACPRSIIINMNINDDCKVLDCRSVVVHNAFSPNGDGINELFVIENIEDSICYPQNTVEIYNRWGILVFETKGYNNVSKVFDGTSQGRTTISQSSGLPTGVYFYILNYTSVGNNGELQTNKKDGYLYLTR